MEVDIELLSSAVRESADSYVVRFYAWDPAAVSIGSNLRLDEEVIRRFERSGLDWVRRPTGGGAVLHRGDLTYSVVGPTRGLGTLDLYGFVAAGLIRGFELLGIEAKIAGHSASRIAPACFAEPTGADLSVKGRKICGSAQLRRGPYFLQHGSIPLDDLRDETRHLLGTREDDSSTFVREIDSALTRDDLVEAIIDGFAVTFGEKPRPLLNPRLLV